MTDLISIYKADACIAFCSTDPENHDARHYACPCGGNNDGLNFHDALKENLDRILPILLRARRLWPDADYLTLTLPVRTTNSLPRDPEYHQPSKVQK